MLAKGSLVGIGSRLDLMECIVAVMIGFAIVVIALTGRLASYRQPRVCFRVPSFSTPLITDSLRAQGPTS